MKILAAMLIACLYLYSHTIAAQESLQQVGGPVHKNCLNDVQAILHDNQFFHDPNFPEDAIQSELIPIDNLSLGGQSPYSHYLQISSSRLSKERLSIYLKGTLNHCLLAQHPLNRDLTESVFNMTFGDGGNSDGVLLLPGCKKQLADYLETLETQHAISVNRFPINSKHFFSPYSHYLTLSHDEAQNSQQLQAAKATLLEQCHLSERAVLDLRDKAENLTVAEMTEQLIAAMKTHQAQYIVLKNWKAHFLGKAPPQ